MEWDSAAVGIGGNVYNWLSFLGTECLCYAGYGFPGKDALEDTAHNGGGFLVNYPYRG